MTGVISAIFMAVQTELLSSLQSRSVTVISVLQIRKSEQGTTMTLPRQKSQENKKANSERGFTLLSTFTLSLLNLDSSQNEKSW